MIYCQGSAPVTLTAVPINYNGFVLGTIGTAIPFTNMASNPHDCQGGVYLGHAPGFTTNYYIIGGASNYASAPANCGTSTGGAGAALPCMYWALGNSVTSGCTGAAFTDICASGSVMLSPQLGVSEWEGGCGPNYTDCYACGQLQRNSALADNGDVVCAHMQPVWNMTNGTLSALNIDTAAATGNPAGACCTAWNFMGGTSVTNNALPGSIELFQHPHDDSVIYSAFAAADGSTGTSTWTVSLPTLGTFTAGSFTYTGGSGSGTTDAANAAAAFNTGSNTRTANYLAVVAGYAGSGSNECSPAPANACVIIYAKTGDPSGLNPATCGVASSGYTTAPTSNCFAANGTSGLFSLGTHCLGPQWMRDYTSQGGHWYETCSNTNSYGPDTSGGTQDQYILHQFIICWGPPVNGITTLYGPSCGMNGFAGIQTSPAALCNNCASGSNAWQSEYLHVVGGGPPPPNQCVPSDCSGTISEYIGTTATAIDFFVKNPATANRASGWEPFTFCMSQTCLPGGSGNNTNGNSAALLSARPGIGGPTILPSYDFALGKPVLDEVYDCYDAAVHHQLCYLEIDQTTGKTLVGNFVESSNTVNLTFGVGIAEQGLFPVVYWNAGGAGFGNGCPTSGGCLYRYTTTNRSTWVRTFKFSAGGGNNVAGGGEEDTDYLDTCQIWHFMNGSTSVPATGSYGLKIFQTNDC